MGRLVPSAVATTYVSIKCLGVVVLQSEQGLDLGDLGLDFAESSSENSSCLIFGFTWTFAAILDLLEVSMFMSMLLFQEVSHVLDMIFDLSKKICPFLLSN